MELIDTILSLIVLSLLISGCSQKSAETGALDLRIEDFSTVINNKYLTLTPGTIFIYEGQTEEGLERIEVYVTNDIRQVMGVNTLVVWDREWLNNELIEDTKDWFAQDKYGNVWYFGEDSKELIDGMVVSTEGSWESGVNGAQPGIVMKANPQVGDTYRQEYYKGVAEDMGEVVALGVQVTGPYGSFTDCLQTKDWTPLEPGDEEYKYYCAEVGNVVYEVEIDDGESAQLIGIMFNYQPPEPVKEEPRQVLKRDITEQEAIAIAQQTVSGRVTDIEIEKKYNRAVYAVEIDDNGRETDVIIDIATGEVLGIET